MKLGTQVGLGPGRIVLDGDPGSPTKRAQPPIFGPCPLWPYGWMAMKPLGMEVGLGPGDFVLDGDPAPPKRGTYPNSRPIPIVAKRLNASRYHLVRR